MYRFVILLGFMLTYAVSMAHGQGLAVLTSFPERLSSTFTQIYREDFPDRPVRVLNKNTVAAVDEILRGNTRDFDVFWASSPEAFEILRRTGAFETKGICGPDGPPSVVPFALSAVGWARRRDTDVFMPSDWDDLLKPTYRGKVAMARPSRSGSAHMMVEQLLQARGWQDGWAYLLELSGNLATLTARSFGVPEGLIEGRFEIGLTIDFLAKSRADLLQMRYGQPIVLVPAQIGILSNMNDPKVACDFLRVLLSQRGQMQLMAPDIGRIPFDPTIRAAGSGALSDDVTAALRQPWIDYDASASADRYWAVNTLFDLLITERLSKRRELWRRLQQLKGQVPPDQLTQIRNRLIKMPIAQDEAEIGSLRIAGGMRHTALVTLGAPEREIVKEWRPRIAKTLAQAERMLDDLEGQVKP